MTSESTEITTDLLSQGEVLRNINFFKKQLSKKISYSSLTAAALIDGKTSEGDYTFETKDWQYVVERLSPPDEGTVTVSVTRFPLNPNSPVFSEGMMLVIRNPRFSGQESSVEYHIRTKVAPNADPISNTRATIVEGKAFLASI